MFKIPSPKTLQAQVKMVSTLEQMQVPNGTGPGVRRSKRPLLASRTRLSLLPKLLVNTYQVRSFVVLNSIAYSKLGAMRCGSFRLQMCF